MISVLFTNFMFFQILIMKFIHWFYMEKEWMSLLILFVFSSRMVIILFHVNTRPYVARMTQKKLTDLGYET